MTTKLRNLWQRFASKAYRTQFAASQISTTVAAQIHAMRDAKGWTQAQLGEAAGEMAQSRISALEDPSYDKMTLSTLKRIAEAFDVALVVRFAPFSELLRWRTNLAPDQLAARSFDDDYLEEDWQTQVGFLAAVEDGCDVRFSSNEDSVPLLAMKFFSSNEVVARNALN